MNSDVFRLKDTLQKTVWKSLFITADKFVWIKKAAKSIEAQLATNTNRNSSSVLRLATIPL